ncbi:protein of unknown function [Cupriavidus taiwanensis]|uniref:Uncharacterized protein n=1 Tax=Cupriavidus taiwanensis TaxID=164546 RepID=A0A375IHJ5_9BURK|nr:hypothetical protein CBM2588_A10073 [Cupriavidus taiwanensis]SOY42359.1 hypothetical protein CBM2592_A10075 [Cupriavidus taiwanensis]SOY78953.1 hypothetical protein CBM2591_A10073 [Cupriavidus taiwanensis]SOZ20778.1 hypothetical protein CBM2608_A10071 [Cupriavidus taiwanensis]SOZ50160.1 hypothetical protein CBM2617_A10023 [Cupriavidus taiwanensis]
MLGAGAVPVPQPGGALLSTSKTKLEPNPLVFFLAPSYKF